MPACMILNQHACAHARKHVSFCACECVRGCVGALAMITDIAIAMAMAMTNPRCSKVTVDWRARLVQSSPLRSGWSHQDDNQEKSRKQSTDRSKSMSVELVSNVGTKPT